jgi:isoquinoline 1-oxidoreductase alpha subunit
MVFKLRVNGADHSVDTEEDTPLLWVLRDILGMTGTKFGCGLGMCGACTVHADGSPIRSCVLAIKDVGGAELTTIEGIGATDLGKKVQDAWLTLDVPQCGYCQGGQILAATALLARTAAPADSDIDAAMAGNICRCGTYTRIRAAIKQVSNNLKN